MLVGIRVTLEVEVEAVEFRQLPEHLAVAEAAVFLDHRVLGAAVATGGGNLVRVRQLLGEVADVVMEKRLQPIAVRRGQAALQRGARGRAFGLGLTGRVRPLLEVQEELERMVAGIEDQAVELVTDQAPAERLPHGIRVVSHPARVRGGERELMLVVAGAQAQVHGGVGDLAVAQHGGKHGDTPLHLVSVPSHVETALRASSSVNQTEVTDLVSV